MLSRCVSIRSSWLRSAKRHTPSFTIFAYATSRSPLRESTEHVQVIASLPRRRRAGGGCKPDCVRSGQHGDQQHHRRGTRPGGRARAHTLLTATGIETGFIRSTQSGTDGTYSLPLLSEGV